MDGIRQTAKKVIIRGICIGWMGGGLCRAVEAAKRAIDGEEGEELPTA